MCVSVCVCVCVRVYLSMRLSATRLCTHKVDVKAINVTGMAVCLVYLCVSLYLFLFRHMFEIRLFADFPDNDIN